MRATQPERKHSPPAIEGAALPTFDHLTPEQLDVASLRQQPPTQLPGILHGTVSRWPSSSGSNRILLDSSVSRTVFVDLGLQGDGACSRAGELQGAFIADAGCGSSSWLSFTTLRLFSLTPSSVDVFGLATR